MTTPNVIERIKSWVDGTRPHDWYGQCAGLTMSICRHFGELDGGPYASAYAAYLESDIVSTDSRKAPPGAIHFWDGYFRGSQGGYGRYGHVAVDLLGNGTSLLSATRYGIMWGAGAGIISEREQSRLIAKNPQGRYLGWALTYGRHRITALTPAPKPEPAGGKPSPVTPPEQEEIEDMGIRIIGVPKDAASRTPFHRYLVIPGVGSVHISDPAHLELLRRYIAAGVGKGKEEVFRDGELAIITSYLRGEKPAAAAKK